MFSFQRRTSAAASAAAAAAEIKTPFHLQLFAPFCAIIKKKVALNSSAASVSSQPVNLLIHKKNLLHLNVFIKRECAQVLALQRSVH
jgi:hypothetical protein